MDKAERECESLRSREGIDLIYEGITTAFNEISAPPLILRNRRN